jgi:hypothetical protein
MSNFRIVSSSILVVFATALFACAAPVTQQERVGFISDYSTLRKVKDDAYLYTGPRVNEYKVFMIEGPQMLFDNETADGERAFSDDEIRELATYFKSRLEKVLTEDGGYTIVDRPASGVATIRLAITALDATVGALNLTIYTKVTGAGLGGAAMEGEMVDSMTQEQLAAAVQWGSGSRFLRAGITKLGDAKLQINQWTANLRRRIDAAHAESADQSADKSTKE